MSCEKVSADVMTFLSQTLWSQRLSPNYHLIVCLAILDKHRHVIMENEFGFTEVLKVREISNHQ